MPACALLQARVRVVLDARGGWNWKQPPSCCSGSARARAETSGGAENCGRGVMGSRGGRWRATATFVGEQRRRSLASDGDGRWRATVTVVGERRTVVGEPRAKGGRTNGRVLEERQRVPISRRECPPNVTLNLSYFCWYIFGPSGSGGMWKEIKGSLVSSLRAIPSPAQREIALGYD